MAKKDFEEKELRDAMNEITTGTRQFETKKFGLLQVRFPTTEEQRLADWEYSRAFTDALKQGFMTNKEIEKIIKERGLWGEEEENKLKELDDQINAEIVYLSKLKSEDKKQPVLDKINALRQERLKLLNERQKLFNISAESKAEEARISYLTYCCTEKAETGKRLWNSYEDFKNENNNEDMGQIVMQFITFINGLPANLFDILPEGGEKQDESGEPDGK